MEFDFAMLIVQYLSARKLICDALAVYVGKILEVQEYFLRIRGKRIMDRLKELEAKNQNKIETKVIHMGVAMPEKKYNKIEIEKPEMKISLLFPSKTEESEEIHKDIKAILSGALREQMEHRTH